MNFDVSAGASIGADLGGAISGAVDAAASVAGDVAGALGGAADAAASVAGDIGGDIGGALSGDLSGGIEGDLGGALAVGGALALGAGLGAALSGRLSGGFGGGLSARLGGSAGVSANVDGFITGAFGTKISRASQKLVKAYFVEAETPSKNWKLECLFNPEKYSVEKTNTWSAASPQAGATRGGTGQGQGHAPRAHPAPAGGAASGGGTRGNLPQYHFGGGGQIIITIPELWFDTALTPNTVNKANPRSRDVRDYTDKLLDMMLVDGSAKDSDLWSQPAQASSTAGPKQPHGRPHMYMFVWGKSYSWKCVVQKVHIDFTLFDPDGTPTRAKASVTLWQVKEEGYKRQNPTSGGEDLRASRVVQPGDTLDLIAYQEYGDATQWRVIARANGLENPRALRAGQRLVVPVR